jgi:diaminopimelate epimerase
MSIMDMKFLVKTYEEIIGYATRHGCYPTHFVIDAKDINDAIQQFITYARDHPRFYEYVNVQDVLATARTNLGMRAGTRKRKSKFSAQKRKHKSKSQKK